MSQFGIQTISTNKYISPKSVFVFGDKLAARDENKGFIQLLLTGVSTEKSHSSVPI